MSRLLQADTFMGPWLCIKISSSHMFPIKSWFHNFYHMLPMFWPRFLVKPTPGRLPIVSFGPRARLFCSSFLWRVATAGPPCLKPPTVGERRWSSGFVRKFRRRPKFHGSSSIFLSIKSEKLWSPLLNRCYWFPDPCNEMWVLRALTFAPKQKEMWGWINLEGPEGPESQNWYGFVSKSCIPHTPEVIPWLYSPTKMAASQCHTHGGPQAPHQASCGTLWDEKNGHPTMGGAWPQSCQWIGFVGKIYRKPMGFYYHQI